MNRRHHSAWTLQSLPNPQFSQTHGSSRFNNSALCCRQIALDCTLSLITSSLTPFAATLTKNRVKAAFIHPLKSYRCAYSFSQALSFDIHPKKQGGVGLSNSQHHGSPPWPSTPFARMVFTGTPTSWSAGTSGQNRGSPQASPLSSRPKCSAFCETQWRDRGRI